MKKIIALFLLLGWLVCAACGGASLPGTEKHGELPTIGQGKTEFILRVTAKDQTLQYQINTDAGTVGEALLALELIAGEESAVGLMITTVCGMPLDYEKDGAYWAFYEDGAYAARGVNDTPIEPGILYEFRYTEG